MSAFLLTFFLALPNPELFDVSGPELIDEIRRSSEPIVVVNVWATWCGPCVRELPMLVEVEKKFEGKVRFMYVSADFKAQRGSVAKVFTAQGGRLPSYFRRGHDQPFIDALDRKWNGTIPATFVFDRHGRKLRSWQGMLSEQDLIGALDGYLNAHRAAR
jgi:thiol-disulfide isomerase/thioredoxin